MPLNERLTQQTKEIEMNPVVRVVAAHALIVGAGAAAATVIMDLIKLAKS